MEPVTFVDGFNLFHRWPRTAGFFRSSTDPEAALHRAGALLAEALSAGERVELVLDGGLRAGRATVGGLPAHYAGPGRCADELMLDLVHRSTDARSVEAVTSDRALAANTRAFGARAISVERFLTRLEAPSRPAASAQAQAKPPPPSRAEVEAWLEVFGDGADVASEELDAPHTPARNHRKDRTEER